MKINRKVDKATGTFRPKNVFFKYNKKSKIKQFVYFCLSNGCLVSTGYWYLLKLEKINLIILKSLNFYKGRQKKNVNFLLYVFLIFQRQKDCLLKIFL